MKKNFLALIIVAATAVLADGEHMISVIAPQEGAARTVTVGGKASFEYASGAEAPLRVTAAAGWAFAGWYKDYHPETGVFSNKVELAGGVDWRTPNAKYKVGEEDETLYARFVTPAEDRLYFDFAAPFRETGDDDGHMIVVPFTNEYDVAVGIDSETLPKVTVSGLPKGLKFDNTALNLSGKAAEPGIYTVKVSASNQSKYSYSQVFTVRVGDSYSPEIVGGEGFFYIDEEVDIGVEDMFYVNNTNSALKTLTVAGLPQGLSMKTEKEDGETYYYIRGTTTKAGFFIVKATALFADGTRATATATVYVEDVDPFEYGVDFSMLEGLRVGDTYTLDHELCIGCYEKEWRSGVQSVSGLPAGLKTEKISDGDCDFLYLTGTLTKPGEYAVSARVSYEDWDTERMMTTTIKETVIVEDAPDMYFSVAIKDPDSAPGCRVTGGGVCAMASSVRLGATAARDYVFAGWYDAGGNPVSSDGNDYRTANQSVFIDENVPMEWFARFVPKTEDTIKVLDLDDSYDLDMQSGMERTFRVESPSVPKLTFKNLPSGVECVISEDFPGEYKLVYDPAEVRRAPKPGKYAVTMTVENLSRNKKTQEFIIRVANITSADISVDDDYGVLTPNAVMTPISFSNAVDFARGDTLKVSGLPSGLKYDDRSAPLCISGTPTKPGEYTLEFTAKVVTGAVTNGTRVTYKYETAEATAFITVKDFPEIAVSVTDEEIAAGNKVTGSGNYKAGSKVTLRATPAKGWVFAGWWGLDGVGGLGTLNPSLSYTMGYDDHTWVDAIFVEVRDDYLWIDEIEDVSLDVGEDLAATDIIEKAVKTVSFPTVKVTSLPAGLKWDAKTFSLSGKPTKAGVYYATVSAKNAGGYEHSRIARFVVGGVEENEVNEIGITEEDFDLFEEELYTGGFMTETGLRLPPSSTSGAGVDRVTVRGLPADIKYTLEEWDGDDYLCFYGTGCFQKPGRYTVTIEVTYGDRSRAQTARSFILRDSGSRYVDVAVEAGSEGKGTVSGAGVYAYGDKLKIKAMAGRDDIFTGWFGNHYASDYDGGDWISGNIDSWYDVCWLTDAKGNAVDYRTPSLSTAVLDDDLFETELEPGHVETVYARFTSKSGDAEIGLLLWDRQSAPVDLDGAELEVRYDEEDGWRMDVLVNSKSLPGKLAFKGVPAGMKAFNDPEESGIEVSDPGRMKPGVYKVTASVSNASKAKAEAVFTLVVPNFTTAALPNLDPATDAYPVSVGVDASEDLVDLAFGEGWEGATLTASGLPAGMKLVKLEDEETEDGGFYYAISGVPTKACTNTVTFKVTNPGTRETAIATITLSVAALPAWAYGNFDGMYSVYEDTEYGLDDVPAGLLSVTVTAQGKISGKILRGGKQYPFTASSFDSVEDSEGGQTFWATTEIAWAATNKVPYTLKFSCLDAGNGVVEMTDSRFCCGMTPAGTGVGDAVQNVWKRKDFEVPAFATGTKAPVLECDGLTLKFGANGVITVSGTVDGVRVNGRSQVLCYGLQDGFIDAKAILYFSNRAFEGGAFMGVCDFRLYDLDGDGRIDTAVLPL